MMGPAESGQGSMGSMGSGQGSMSSGQGSMGSGQMHGQAGGAGNGAVYVLIENRGREADTLLGASSDAAQTVELHETRQAGGMMRMRPLAKVEVPAGGRIEMKPGGQHIMLLGLTRDLHPGDKVTVRLRFEKAGEQTVEAEVR
jgi:copper(I)-binding protein